MERLSSVHENRFYSTLTSTTQSFSLPLNICATYTKVFSKKIEIMKQGYGLYYKGGDLPWQVFGLTIFLIYQYIRIYYGTSNEESITLRIHWK